MAVCETDTRDTPDGEEALVEGPVDGGENDGGETFALESLCTSCFENGETRMLLTKIPHFREVMVVSFDCSHCGNRNNEVKFTGQFGEEGVQYTLRIPKGRSDVLSRQVVKSESCSVRVPELDFEIPSTTQKGSITTVEGLLGDAVTGLSSSQPQRRIVDSAVADAVETFIGRLQTCVDGECDFSIVVDDPAGNSYVESPDGMPDEDELLEVAHYRRTRQQQLDLGLLAEGEEADQQARPEIAPDDVHHGRAPQGAAAMHRALAKVQGAASDALISRYAAPEEVLEFPGHCSACMAPCTSRMFQIHIPFFKEVILMADSCDVCGYKNSEVKGGGAVSERGRSFTLRVEEPADLQRDVLKAETASVSVPELDLEVSTGTLGGLITTVEGLLVKIKDALQETRSFQLGDSADQLSRGMWRDFFERMQAAIDGRIRWTLALRDPLANSFVSPRNDVTDEAAPDAQLTDEWYDRSAEEDEEYGIDHLKAHQTGAEKEEQAPIGGSGGHDRCAIDDESEGQPESPGTRT